MVFSFPAARAFLLSIVESADAIEPITKALSSKPANMHTAVKYASTSVSGSMSYGTMAVTIPAPQKKACANCAPRVALGERSSARGCQSLGMDGSAASASSMSATNHQAQPIQWQQPSIATMSLTTRIIDGLNLITSCASRALLGRVKPTWRVEARSTGGSWHTTRPARWKRWQTSHLDILEVLRELEKA